MPIMANSEAVCGNWRTSATRHCSAPSTISSSTAISDRQAGDLPQRAALLLAVGIFVAGAARRDGFDVLGLARLELAGLGLVALRRERRRVDDGGRVARPGRSDGVNVSTAKSAAAVGEIVCRGRRAPAARARAAAAAETGTSAVCGSTIALSGVANQVFLQPAQRTVRPAAPSAASWIW